MGLAFVAVIPTPHEGRAQIVGGVFGAYAQDVFDGTPGELKERSPSGRLDDVFREITTAAAPARG